MALSWLITKMLGLLLKFCQTRCNMIRFLRWLAMGKFTTDFILHLNVSTSRPTYPVMLCHKFYSAEEHWFKSTPSINSNCLFLCTVKIDFCFPFIIISVEFILSTHGCLQNGVINICFNIIFCWRFLQSLSFKKQNYFESYSIYSWLYMGSSSKTNPTICINLYLFNLVPHKTLLTACSLSRWVVYLKIQLFVFY